MGKRKGFTFVEISLFLAVTAALFIGIAASVQNSMFQQRYNDAVQNFYEFVKSIYSKVSNPQSPGKGNSNVAIYGKLVVFGETTDILGNPVGAGEKPIFMYDVVGDAKSTYDMASGDVSKMLANLQANVVRFETNSSGTITTGVTLASPEKYEPRWQIDIKDTSGNSFKGAIMVVRHPRSGTINTLVLDNTVIEANSEVAQADAVFKSGGNYPGIRELLTQYLTGGSASSKFGTKEVDFCVDPYTQSEVGAIPRQDIRILNNARNASSVEMIDTDGDDNRCTW